MDVKLDTNGRPYFMWGDNKMRLEDEPVIEKKYKEKAELELRETPENVKAGLEELRKLLRGEKSCIICCFLQLEHQIVQLIRDCLRNLC